MPVATTRNIGLPDFGEWLLSRLLRERFQPVFFDYE
jgi:hypothetical protein